MGTGYTRQSASSIATSEDITAAPLNAEFNQLQSAFDSSSGHSHDGTSGEGPLIDLTTSITGILPVARGGIAAKHNISATTAPTTTDDSGSGYGPGSTWTDVTNDTAYICLDATSTAAVWRQISFEATLAAIEDLTPTDGNIIVGNGSTWVAESGATARTSLGVGTGDSPQFTAVNIGHATDTSVTRVSAGVIAVEGDTVLTSSAAIGTTVQAWDADLDAIAALAKTDGNFIVGNGSAWVAESGATARASLGLTIGTDVQAYDADLAALAGLTSAANKIPYFTGSATADLLTFFDEDNMASNSATGVASQQSIKAYVDAQTYGITDIVSDTTPQLGGTLDLNAQAIQFPGATVTDVTGADTLLVSGTAGTSGNVAMWNADGDLVDGSQVAANIVVDADIGVSVQAYDADTLKADTSDTLAAGFAATAVDDGTKSSGTYTPDVEASDSNFLYIVNGGAFTLGVPSKNCTIVLHVTNNGTAGAITTSSYTLVDGDSLDTTDTNEFVLFITVVNDVSILTVKALQ